jgi:DNA-binding MarR family transcriptional regulator
MDGAIDQVELVRDFNRYYTRRLGVLSDRYLGQDRTLGEARLLFEIGATADVRDLRIRLGLDSGYLSRLLRSLERQRLVRVHAHPSDGRARVAELTPAG